ncbi:MAG: DNA repair protein RecO [Firmicutes bacterium]|nr:DNA repair protein RecO [Bacillota bacterium]
MGLYHCEGIILRTRSFGEADRIVTLFTKEKGKIEAVARGARRPRNRLVGVTQQFSYLKALIFTGKSLDQLSQAELIKSFAPLRDDLLKMAYASWWAEVLDVFLPLNEVNSDVFLFFLAGLVVLERVPDPILVSRAFELRLLRYLGYEPVLDRCVGCRRTAGPFAGFAPAEGGLLCPACAGAANGQLIPVRPATVSFLRTLYQADLRVLARRPVDPALGHELGRLLFTFIQLRAEKPLKALSFLQSLTAWTPPPEADLN